MSLWVDKYRPVRLNKLSYHDDISQRLTSLSSMDDFPHLLVYGPSGAGKKTRVYAVLHQLYGNVVDKMKIDVRTFTTASNRKLEFNVVSSNNHLEITPSDLGNNDRVVIQDLLKEIASTEQVDFQTGKVRFKVVVINEADSLSRDAQAALRRTMEKYSKNIRLIMVANSTSNIISPIKSRTLLVRVGAPTMDEVVTVLKEIAEKEKIAVSDELLMRIAQDSGRNLRKAILCFESLYIVNGELKDTVKIPDLDWEGVIKKMAQSIVRDCSVRNVAEIRNIMYELLAHCIPARIILKSLLFQLLPLIDDEAKLKVVEAASTFDERLSLGTKSIFHLEGFVTRSMVALCT